MHIPLSTNGHIPCFVGGGRGLCPLSILRFIDCSDGPRQTFAILVFRVELCAEMFYAIITTLIPCSLLICYPYILLHFNVSLCHFSSSRCMLELKFAIYHRAACTGFLRRCVRYWLRNHWAGICSNTESTMDVKDSPCPCTPTIFLIQWSWVIIIFH